MAAGSGGDQATIIGPDAVFKGELTFEKSVQHLGRFEGQIQTKGHLLVAEGARLDGEVSAGSIDVEGEVKGNLRASGKIRLTSTAKLEGDLHTARLEVADGAVFVGRCVVGPNGSAERSVTGAKPSEAKPVNAPAKSGTPAKP
ncbi:MAG: polymer-forming cytoskeletal protein [Phycisphaerae bacterium]